MAIHETKKQSDLEKRLKLLRQQVYGKQPEIAMKPSSYAVKKTIDDSRALTQPSYVTTSSDITYLYNDLIKIGILSGLAIGAQIILFLKINFF